MATENAIEVYTDGSSFSHPRLGGIGIRLVVINELGQEESQDIFIPGCAGATNNQMELKACITGIEEAMRTPSYARVKCVVIHSNSLYVVNNRNNAFFNWSKRRWRNSSGKPVANADLWKELMKTVKAVYASGKRVEFRWVKGHGGDIHNRAADKLARKSARNAINPPLSNVGVRRKFSTLLEEPGCVPMKKQRISIPIITGTYLVLQRCYKYKYEVVSKASPQYKKVDSVFSDIPLREGHCYSIRFNDDQNNPTIMKLFKEVPCRRPKRRRKLA